MVSSLVNGLSVSNGNDCHYFQRIKKRGYLLSTSLFNCLLKKGKSIILNKKDKIVRYYYKE